MDPMTALRRSPLAAATALAVGSLLAGCGGPAASPTSTPQVSGSATTSATTSATGSATASPTGSASASAGGLATTAVPRTPVRTPTPARTTATGRPLAAPTPVGGPYVTWVQPAHGCLTVGPSIVGVKVYLVQRALHLVGHGEQYDAATTAAVRAFQTAHLLPVTGLVDEATWSALGTGYPFCVDRYTAEPVVAASATAAARIEAMIAYATSRVGTAYMWGGAGPIGFDCSGLVIQAMYAGGRIVPGLNTDLHVQASFRDTNYMYASQLLHVPLSQRRRGDLVFYGPSMSHMAIYLGNGEIVEAVRPVIRIASLYADGLAAWPYVVRPFP
jgi:cell wall-associated NlpC family hydrolase